MIQIERAAACPPDGIMWLDGRCVPDSVAHTLGAWVVNIAVPIASIILLAIIIWDCTRRKTLTWSFLLAVASASTFWLETYGDWAQHLEYSPLLNHYHLNFRYAAPHNPSAMPLLYALYWWAHAWAILRLAQWLQRRRPGMSLGVALVVLSAPVTFVWNLVIEGAATYFGLWTYNPPIGPAIHWSTGGYWPLMWPVFLMFGWINLIAWMIGPPEEQHRLNRIEKLFRLGGLLSGEERDPTRGGISFQIVRLLSWIVFFNATFALTLVLPLLVVRIVGGLDTPYMP